MKHLFLTLLLCAVSVMPTLAQVRGGIISGTVQDQQGGVLPGASVTAQGLDATIAVTTIADGTYHFLDLAPGPYKVTAGLTGFSTVVRDNIIVAVGRTVDVPLTLNVAAQAETIEVTGAAPMIDETVSGTAANFTIAELISIPTSRDPFALMRGVPGVLLDQVNVGGNETGQQAIVFGKGTRQQDTTWTIDGVEITDMGAPGQSPTYFNFDNFEEIRVATAGNEITARTGGVGINLITKRGTNRYHGGIRGYLSNNSMESSNVPAELKALATPITPENADHTLQTSDWGFDLGGPLMRDRAWFYASMSRQDIRIFKRSTKAEDRTRLNNPQVKVNWQATKKDLVNFLFFNGFKVKSGRSNTANASTFEAFEATLHQDNAYADNPLHGLFKIGDDRVVNSNMFLSAAYAYYNTGIKLTPEGGLDAQAGRNVALSRAYGSTVQTLQLRPQHSVTVNANNFARAFGASHNIKYGVGYRKVLSQTQVEWPGNGILGIVQAQDAAGNPTDLRAQVFRQTNGANLVKYLDFYVGDTLSFGRATIDAGVRYDKEWGEALASTTDGSKAFPTAIPGVIFPGYKSPFTWKNFSPRGGLSYVFDAEAKTVGRASYSRFAAQLAPSTVGTRNTSTGSTPGNATYRWTDLNGDRFAQADEVDLTQQIGNSAGGFNSANPTALAPSPNVLDPDLKAPVTQTFVAGLERELRPNLAVMVDYTYNRTSDLFGNMTANITPRVGVPLSAYVAGPTLTGTLPDGTAYSVPTFMPTGVTAGNITTNVPGYYIDYHGLEVHVVKRLSNRWMGRLALSFNNSREHFKAVEGRYNTNGNPTGTPAEPLIDGGQYAPTQSVSTGIFMNAKWQMNANAMYQAPYGIEIAANLFGRQGYPLPIYRGGITLGSDQNQNILVSPRLDSFRLANVWDTDLRFAKNVNVPAGSQMLNVRIVGDIFNLFNANTELVRTSNIGGLGTNGALAAPAATFGVLSKNLSPRIVRVGLVVGF